MGCLFRVGVAVLGGFGVVVRRWRWCFGMDLEVGCGLGGGGERLWWYDGGGRRHGFSSFVFSVFLLFLFVPVLFWLV
jgi:hypothetical protein